MQNLPPSRRIPPQNSTRPVNAGQQPGAVIPTTGRPYPNQAPKSGRPSLQVQQSYVHPGTGQRVTRSVRVPAVNTLKSGGPRLEPLRNQHADRMRMAARARAKKRQAICDYLLGLTAGLIVFGIAAIFVCQALIEMFLA